MATLPTGPWAVAVLADEVNDTGPELDDYRSPGIAFMRSAN
ncbi:MAG TPA: hypothetical protein VGL63_15525 [Streptosporangiaceae bacterium]